MGLDLIRKAIDWLEKNQTKYLNMLLFNRKGVKHDSMCDRREDSRHQPLLQPDSDTDFRDFLDEVEQLAGFAPEIIEAIEKDLDVHAREKKKLRLEDRRFFESRTAELPELKIEEEEDILATESCRPIRSTCS